MSVFEDTVLEQTRQESLNTKGRKKNHTPKQSHPLVHRLKTDNSDIVVEKLAREGLKAIMQSFLSYV